jgi:fibronectin type 3 domain-containing protein
VTFTDAVGAERQTAQQNRELSILRYVIVGAAGRRAGGPSQVLDVPLAENVPAPPTPTVTYNETTLVLSWTPTPGQTVRVYKSDSAGKDEGPPLSPVPLVGGQFTEPVQFGAERCLAIRTALVRGVVSIESPPSPPACATPVDTFAPAAPTGLSPQATDGKITLFWNAVTAGDLAGYLVLRAEGAGPLQPLMTTPITETQYSDTSVKSGVSYAYVVIAVDKAGNRSEPSNRVEEVAR